MTGPTTALTAGTRLGPYQIIKPIGAGGMGEVYKASDTRLDRVVAVKLLIRHWTENPEMRERRAIGLTKMRSTDFSDFRR